MNIRTENTTPGDFRKRFDERAAALDREIELQRQESQQAALNEASAIVSAFLGDVKELIRKTA